MRILVAVACLLPFALAAEAGIARNSPEAAVKAAYAADAAALQGRGPGIMADNALRARFFSRSLLLGRRGRGPRRWARCDDGS